MIINNYNLKGDTPLVSLTFLKLDTFISLQFIH